MCEIDWELLFKFCVLIATFMTAIIGLRKFQYEKNRDYYLRRLNEVYSPLFSVIIKQETYRDVYSNVNSAIKNPPLIFSESIQGDVYTSFKDFEQVLESINKGLARPVLLIRLNQYKQLRELMNYYAKQSNRTDISDKISIKLSSDLNRIGADLRNEIVDGYLECISKLNLKNNTKELKNYYFESKSIN